MIEIKIDEEFKNKIPAMRKDAFEGLKADILKDGYVRDPLVVWKEENTLVDGHHRWRIINENSDALDGKFKIDYRSFKDRWDAVAWICANQLHKRNLTEAQRAVLIKEEYEAKLKVQGRTGESDHGTDGRFTKSPKRGDLWYGKKPLKTRDRLAAEHNVSPRYIDDAVAFGRGLDRAEEVVPGFKADVLNGTVKTTKKTVSVLRNMGDVEVRTAVEAIRNPQKNEAPAMKGKTAAKIVNAKISEVGQAMEATERKTQMAPSSVVSMFRASCSDFVAREAQLLEMWGSIIREDRTSLDEIKKVLDETKETIERIIGDL